jgi:hypothetical protein
MKSTKVILCMFVLIILSQMAIETTVLAESINSSKRVATAHYPSRFERLGILSFVDREEVIVDNVHVPMASTVRFMTPYNENSTFGAFVPGQRVGYVVNEKGQIIVLCLLLESKEAS